MRDTERVNLFWALQRIEDVLEQGRDIRITFRLTDNGIDGTPAVDYEIEEVSAAAHEITTLGSDCNIATFTDAIRAVGVALSTTPSEGYKTQ
jgi:hypothetical protein